MFKNMLTLHLTCLAGAFILYSLSAITFSLTLTSVTMVSALFIFYLSLFETLSAAGLPEKIIDRQVRDDYEKNKEEYLSELQQARRKREFQEAFLSDQEKEDNKKERDELALYNENYELAKSTFKQKDKSEMNDFEKMHYYNEKLRLMNKYSRVPFIVLMYSLGFLTLFNDYLSLKVLIIVYLPLTIVIIPFFAFQKVLSSKVQRLKDSVQPRSIKKLFEDLGI